MTRYFMILSFLVSFVFAASQAGAQETSGGFLGGSVLIGYDNRACSGTLEGAIRYNSTGGATTQSSEDFEGGASGWSDNTTDATETANFTEFLGRFGDSNGTQAVSKTYTLLGTQSVVTIEFDFYQIDSWDVNEPFKIFINDVEELSHDYFHGGAVPSTSGSLITGGLGSYTASDTSPANIHLGFDASSNNFWDRHHHYVLTINSSASSIKLGFGINTDESLANESYGIDNVTVSGDTGGAAMQFCDGTNWIMP